MQVDFVHLAAATWNTIDMDKVRGTSWFACESLGPWLQRRFSGRKTVADYIENLFMKRYPDGTYSKLRAAVIGCGDMAHIGQFLEDTVRIRFKEVDGFDISCKLMQKYKPHKIRFNPIISDCNNVILEENRYDFIIGHHSIHHIYNLGGLFFQCHKSLMDKGLLHMNEWIGPTYLQIPQMNRLIAALLLFLLFPSKKTRTAHDGSVKGLKVQHTPNTFDPSEACNSTELMTQYRKYFNPLKTIKYGGLGYPMFEGIIGNINQKRRFSRFRIRFVLWIERFLETIHIIKPLFIMSVGEKRKLMEEKWLADKRAHMIEMEELKRKCLPMVQTAFYSINSKMLSHLVKPLQDVRVRSCADGLKITIKGPYPQLELPAIHVPPGAPLIIKVQVLGSTDGYLKFYYRSKTSDDYIEEKNVQKKVYKGHNEIYFEFIDEEISGPMRLDTAKHAAEYTIRGIDYYTRHPIFSINNPQSFSLVRAIEQVKMQTESSGLKIFATGSDPQLMLPSIPDFDKGPLIVRIRLISPTDTFLQLFWRSDTDSDFNEAFSVIEPLHAGENTVFLRLSVDSAPGLKIRLDPGAAIGEYFIRSIKFYASSPKNFLTSGITEE